MNKRDEQCAVLFILKVRYNMHLDLHIIANWPRYMRQGYLLLWY